MKKLLLLASAIGLVAGPLAAQLNYVVDSTAAWAAYVNVFNVSDDSYAGFGFPEGTPSTMSANFNGTGDVLTLSPNSRIYDQEIANAAWIDQGTLLPNWYIEANYYQERVGSDANTQLVEFTYTVTSNTLITDTSDPLIQKGYSAVSFIKVLDGFQSWATYQSVFGPMTVGTHTISLTVNDSGLSVGGTIVVQVGFGVTGDIQPTQDPNTFEPNPILSTGVNLTAVPEPSTFALLGGLLALGFVIYRRRK